MMLLPCNLPLYIRLQRGALEYVWLHPLRLHDNCANNIFIIYQLHKDIFGKYVCMMNTLLHSKKHANLFTLLCVSV